jgi:hypothetical protein
MIYDPLNDGRYTILAISLVTRWNQLDGYGLDGLMNNGIDDVYTIMAGCLRISVFLGSPPTSVIRVRDVQSTASNAREFVT